MTIEIIPAILPKSFQHVCDEAERVHEFASRMQIDVANGSYAPSKTWPYTSSEHFDALVAQEEGLPMWDEIEYEVDLLIREPLEELRKWISAGVAGAVVHIESAKEHADIFEIAQEAGLSFGWGIKPSTNNDVLFEIIDELGMPSFVQVMGNDQIGHHGVELDESVYEKIADIRARYPELDIAVDIGVNADTALLLIDAGATKLVSGSFVLGSLDPRGAMEELKMSE